MMLIKIRKKLFLAPLPALLAALLFFACAGTQAGIAAPPAAAGQAPAPREEPPGSADLPPGADTYAEIRPRTTVKDELVMTMSAGEVELDFRQAYLASEAQIFTALYEGLFSYHPFTMEPVPALAVKWETSEDKKTWTFHLRSKARWENGDPLTANDFVNGWISLLEPERNAPYSSLFDIIDGARDFRTGKNKNPSSVGISAKDDKTLVVRLSSPASFFPSMLCHHSFSPIHSSMVDKTGTSDWKAGGLIGNGPFTLQTADGASMVLVKNKNYWDAENVVLEKVTIMFTENPEDASALWNSGQSRWISGDVDLEALTDRSGVQLTPMFATHYYYIRSGKTPWNNAKVREALVLALPWDKIREGHILPAKTLIYPISGYPEIKGVDETDLDKAKKLLEEAGYAKGAGLPDMVIRITPSEDAARIAKIMAETWTTELGVPVKIDVVPYASYFASLKQDDYGVGFSTWIGDFADPYTFLQMWRKDSNLNDAKYSDDDYERLMDKSMGEDGEARYTTLSQAEELLLSRGAVMPISYTPALNVVDMDELDGWYPNALDIHPFKYFSFRALKPLPGVVWSETANSILVSAPLQK